MGHGSGSGRGGDGGEPLACKQGGDTEAHREECRPACRRLFGPSVLLVLLIVGVLGGSAVYNGWVRPIGLREHGPLELVLFGAELLLLVSSYLACVARGPGFVPRGWAPGDEKLRDELRQQPGAWPLGAEVAVRDCLQWCRHCSGYKPPRAHHCSVCGRCALWMDHHCPWTNTCIGHDNLKFFTLFVHYVPIACAHAFVIHSEVPCRLVRMQLWTRRAKFWSYLWKTRTVITILVWVASLVVALLVGSLAWEMHASLDTNVTFVESLVEEKAQSRRLRCKEPRFEFPYDLGRRRNWELLMGPRGIRWLLPVGPRLGHDSFWPPVRVGSGPFDLSTEQIAQKAHKLSKSLVTKATEDFEGSGGGWCSLFWCRMMCRLGIRAVCCCEACEGARLDVQTGDELLVGFKGDDWVLGKKLRDGTDAPSGWLPRRCVDLDGAAKYQVPFQEALQGRWDTPQGNTVSVIGVCVCVSASGTPCALRAEGGSSWLQGARLLECNGQTARWSSGETWQRPLVPEDGGQEPEPGVAPEVKKDQ